MSSDVPHPFVVPVVHEIWPADGRRRRIDACPSAVTPAEAHEDQRRRVEASLLRSRRSDRAAHRRLGVTR